MASHRLNRRMSCIPLEQCNFWFAIAQKRDRLNSPCAQIPSYEDALETGVYTLTRCCFERSRTLTKELSIIMIKTILRKIRQLILTVIFFGTTGRLSITNVFSLCLIKHRTIRKYDGVGLWFKMFLNLSLDKVKRSASLCDCCISDKIPSMSVGLKTMWSLDPILTFL
jgi:hypothetical protein